jgi:hypothetical protein
MGWKIMIKVKFKVLNKTWTLRVMERKKYHKKNGKDSVGITKFWKRTIDLHPTEADLFSTIVHELCHAYHHESHIGSMNEVTNDDVIEFFCELIGQRIEEITALGRELEKQVIEYITPKAEIVIDNVSKK